MSGKNSDQDQVNKVPNGADSSLLANDVAYSNKQVPDLTQVGTERNLNISDNTPRFGIAQKLMVSFGLILMVLIFMTFTFRKVVEDSIKTLDHVRHTYEVLEIIEGISARVSDTMTVYRGFIITGQDEYLEPYRERKASVYIEINRLKDVTTNQNLLQPLDKMILLMQGKFKELEETIRLRKEKGFTAAQAAITKGLGDGVTERIRLILGQMHTIETNLLNERTTLQKKIQHRISYIIIGVTIIAFLVVIGATIWITKSISNPIREIVERLSQLAQASGDLTQELSVNSSDETGLLARAFNQLIKGFKNIVLQVQNASLTVNSSSNQILAQATEQESTINEQAAQMNQIKASLTQLRDISTELASNSKIISDNAQKVGMNAEEGVIFVEKADGKIKTLNQSSKAVEGKLGILNERIEGIGRILETIISVSDQTNLLSLNAAIEAAKAGEHGKGFSVVAEEIRRLADQTSQSSKEISGLIREIQIASSAAVMGMEKSNSEVKVSSEIVLELGKRFSDITEQIQKVLPQIENITQSIAEQASGAKQISLSVDEMSNAINVSSAGMAQTRQSIQLLADAAGNLRGTVDQFKVK
ncbi:MAG: methyl-accepting chemotaxis protein [Bacteriovoracaceae bacterium]|nr:methyl-accepting chemotaxis protein [Bacteriovoracaceae bacterium]